MNRSFVWMAALVFLILIAGGLEWTAKRTHARTVEKATLLAAVRNGGADPVALMQRVVSESGLAGQTRTAPDAPPDILRLHIEDAPFETVVTLLARLEERERVRPSTVRLEAAASAGRVRATLDFTLSRR